MVSKIRLIVGLLTVVSFVVASPVVGAQDSTMHTTRRNCWRGRPAPTCDQFLLTEFNFFRAVVNPTEKRTVTYGLDSGTYTYTYETRRSDWKLSAEVGGMVNRGKKSAFGGTLLLDGGPDGGSVGLKARYRRWLTPEGVALDFGAGVRTTRGGESYDYVTTVSGLNSYRGPRNSVGFTGDVAINAMDYVAIVTRLDVDKFNDRVRPTISLGVRAESRPAVFAIAGVGVTFGLLVALLFAAWDD